MLPKKINYYLFIILATGLLYLWQCHHYPMINPDGVTYLESAAAYLTGGIKSVLAFGAQAEWPFYSICIAYVHLLTGASIPVSERLLDGFFIIASACEFLYLTQLFSRHKAAYFWGIVIWLTWHSYVKWWPQVVRDHGFIASLLLSVIFYYRFIVTRRFFWALLWSVSILLAEAFRIEAILYLIVVPFAVFFLKNETFSQRCYLWLKLNVLSIVFMLIVIVLFCANVFTLHSLRFEYIWQEFSRFYVMIADRFVNALNVMHAQIFYRENDFVAYGLIASYVVVFLGYIISQMSLAVFLSLFFIQRAWNYLNGVFLRPVFWVYGGVAIITPLLFFVEHAFLNGRYLLPLGAFSLLLVASSLPYIIDSLAAKKKIYFILLISILLFTNLLANVFRFGHVAQDDYVISQWLQQNYPNQTVFTNVKSLFFYTPHALGDQNAAAVYQFIRANVDETWLREHDVWCQYDLLMIEIPIDKNFQWQELFAQFKSNNRLGPIVKRFVVSSHQEEVLIAPVNRVRC